ncbi:hypothetical protein Pan97_32980 [Bremerella volcania]|uniref:Uncharacterized protein n=1 Tax=Bremerella volcania TaxID=2527984 RepID=A0A518CAJ6_9BACT|nr:hypothetical protein Pan97_32980 [Bremerella volcania]
MSPELVTRNAEEVSRQHQYGPMQSAKQTHLQTDLGVALSLDNESKFNNENKRGPPRNPISLADGGEGIGRCCAAHTQPHFSLKTEH